ncbi:MAG: CHAP domain-containing protein [Lachnospiraceae bacterium]|nr:CHAP domain-containing protein [Lachnospiraceae bacterium]
MKRTCKRLLFFLVAMLMITTVMQPYAGHAEAKSTTQRLKQQSIRIVKRSKQAVDTLNGVKAYYRKGPNDGSNKFYSCAAFVKRYYKTVYGVNVNNLLYNRTPHAEGDSFKKIKDPRVGDIVAMNTGHGTTHWAIAKSVSEDGSTITLIEQNWKWTQGGSTVSVKNRKVKTSKVRLYRLKSDKKIEISLIADEN